MGPRLNLETREEIQRIKIDAGNDPQAAGDTTPEPQPEKVPKKRKTRENFQVCCYYVMYVVVIISTLKLSM
jgi:hypothetical protein